MPTAAHSEVYLKHATMAPKHDPAPLAAIMAAATSKIGVVATMSTTFYPPFLLARLCSTLDSIADGRFGWNIVTSGEDGSAQNFGMDKLHRARPALRHRRRVRRPGLPAVGLVGARRGGAGPGDRYVRGLQEGARDRLRGQVLQVPRPVEHGALTAGPPDVRAGRRLAKGPRVRGEVRRLDHRRRERGGGHEGVSRRCPGQGRRHGRNPDDIKVLFVVGPMLGDDRGGGAGQQARPRPTTRPSSSRHWRASRRSPTSTSRSSSSTSRCPSWRPTASEVRWTSSPSGAAARRCASWS